MIISGYTVNTIYEAEIKDLEASIKKYDLPYKFYPYECKGDWVKNTMVKAEIIKAALTEFPNEDIIWLDADAVILEEPGLFYKLHEYDFDISCHFYKTRRNPRELLSGTVIFKNTSTARALVDDWVKMPNIDWDQRKLQYLVDGKYAEILKILLLPENYVKIRPRNVPDVKSLSAVIGHKQLSRKTRKIKKI